RNCRFSAWGAKDFSIRLGSPGTALTGCTPASVGSMRSGAGALRILPLDGKKTSDMRAFWASSRVLRLASAAARASGLGPVGAAGWGGGFGGGGELGTSAGAWANVGTGVAAVGRGNSPYPLGILRKPSATLGGV